MAAPPQLPAHSTQPTTYKLTLASILSLPFRICNPPPAVGKVRSCGVTPLLKVRLEDVLDRKHLPPLGLKDFEEWLLYVEMCPENLYFILWLREYRTRYDQWLSQTQFQRDSADSEYRPNWSSQNSSHLAMFYARAKQTFFTPNAVYELNLSSDLLAPFHAPNNPPHPDPIIFAAVEAETMQMLQESLRRFVSAQLTNVGNNRVMCGMIAGVLFSLMGFIPPVVVNFVQGNSRWARIAAFPGLWIGLTIFLAAIHGICMGVYIFGDLRQLRKFELARPAISKPKPLPGLRMRPFTPMIAVTPVTQPVVPPLAIIPPPPPSHTHSHHSLSAISRTTTHTSESSASASSGSLQSYSGADQIIISPAYYDADIIEGPATSPTICNPDYTFPDKEREFNEDGSRLSLPSTAGFILPFEQYDDDDDIEKAKSYPGSRYPLPGFDFDTLPPQLPYRKPTNHRGVKRKMEGADSAPAEPESSMSGITGIIARFQNRCAKTLSRGIQSPFTHSNHSQQIQDHTRDSSFGSTPTPTVSEKTKSIRSGTTEKIVRKRFRLVKAVPAFAVPLTRVLNPVIVRGQWEIVVRSAVIAFGVSWAVVGVLLAIPVPA